MSKTKTRAVLMTVAAASTVLGCTANVEPHASTRQQLDQDAAACAGGAQKQVGWGYGGQADPSLTYYPVSSPAQTWLLYAGVSGGATGSVDTIVWVSADDATFVASRRVCTRIGGTPGGGAPPNGGTAGGHVTAGSHFPSLNRACVSTTEAAGFASEIRCTSAPE
jgi:hypothetical protein